MPFSSVVPKHFLLVTCVLQTARWELQASHVTKLLNTFGACYKDSVIFTDIFQYQKENGIDHTYLTSNEQAVITWWLTAKSFNRSQGLNSKSSDNIQPLLHHVVKVVGSSSVSSTMCAMHSAAEAPFSNNRSMKANPRERENSLKDSWKVCFKYF